MSDTSSCFSIDLTFSSITVFLSYFKYIKPSVKLVTKKMTPNQIVYFLKNEDESAPKTDSEDPPNIDPKSSVFEG